MRIHSPEASVSVRDQSIVANATNMPIAAIAAPAPAPLFFARLPLVFSALVEEALEGEEESPERVAEPELLVAEPPELDALAVDDVKTVDEDEYKYKSEDAYCVHSEDAGTLG